jgi:hypothetical protein
MYEYFVCVLFVIAVRSLGYKIPIYGGRVAILRKRIKTDITGKTVYHANCEAVKILFGAQNHRDTYSNDVLIFLVQ